MKTPSPIVFSAILASLFIVAFTACDLHRTAPPPSPVDSFETELPQETLRTQIVSLNKRYENADSRIAENQQRIKDLEEELISLRQSIGVLGPARRPSPVKKASRSVSDDVAKKKPLPSATTSADARGLYDSAFKAYSQRDFPTAISRFQEFISAFPSSDLADNAFYWIGESYYAKEDFERAISNFLKVPDRYPHGNKVPDALFKIGLSYAHLKNPQKARAFYTRVMDNYPFSDAAQKAKANLDQLE